MGGPEHSEFLVSQLTSVSQPRADMNDATFVFNKSTRLSPFKQGHKVQHVERSDVLQPGLHECGINETSGWAGIPRPAVERGRNHTAHRGVDHFDREVDHLRIGEIFRQHPADMTDISVPFETATPTAGESSCSVWGEA